MVLSTIVAICIRTNGSLVQDTIEEDVLEEEPSEEALSDNISEPVQTIIKLFKDNPRDFKLLKGFRLFKDMDSYYLLHHIPSNTTGLAKAHDIRHYSVEIDKLLLTVEESYALSEVFYPYYKERNDRYHELVNKRKDKNEMNLRKSITTKLLSSTDTK